MKFTDFVTYFNGGVTKPGQNGSEFEVHFSTHWFIEQHGLTACTRPPPANPQS